MINIPQGWEKVRLGNICSFINGDAYKETDWTTTGFPIIRIQNLNDPTKPFNYWAGSPEGKVKIKNGDLLLAWSGTPGTSFGAHIWNRGDALLNQHIFRVDIINKELNPVLVKYAINQVLDIMIEKSHGGVGLRHITKKEIEALEIPLPPPEEQGRIAIIIETQLAAVEKAKRMANEQLAAAEDYQRVFLKSYFNSALKCVELNELLEEISYGYTASADFEIAAPKLLRITDIQNGKVNWDSLPGCNADKGGQQHVLHDGDIVIARTGGTIGKSFLIVSPPENTLYASYLIRIALRRDRILPRYMQLFFNSYYYWEQLKEMSQGAGQPNVNTTSLKQLKIPLVSIQKQAAIVNEVFQMIERFSELFSLLNNQMKSINALPAAVLCKAFSGEL